MVENKELGYVMKIIKNNLNMYNQKAKDIILNTLDDILQNKDIKIYSNDEAVIVYNKSANLISLCVGNVDGLSDLWSELKQSLRLNNHNTKVYINAPEVLVSWLTKEGFKALEEVELLDTRLYHMICDLSLTQLGSKVIVEVDKPYGHNHHYLEDEINQINSGYVIDEHGNFLDVYICGIYEELASFEGYVVGILTKRDGKQHYLVTKELDYDKAQCINDIAFEQQYHDVSLEWL